MLFYSFKSDVCLSSIIIEFNNEFVNIVIVRINIDLIEMFLTSQMTFIVIDFAITNEALLSV